MVSREGYYDYMLRRNREEDAKNKNLNKITIVDLMKKEITEMQKSIHLLQMRIKELAEDNYILKEQNANLYNNEH